MNDMTVGEFCRKFGDCEEGRRWAYNLTPNKSKEMMSVVWDHLTFGDYLGWVISRDGVFTYKELRLFACRCVRETPLADGRNVWDLLTDERSRNAVVVAEKFANGEATIEELAAARVAAGAAAMVAAMVAAMAAAMAAAREAAGEAAREAAGEVAGEVAGATQKSFLENPFERG